MMYLTEYGIPIRLRTTSTSSVIPLTYSKPPGTVLAILWLTVITALITITHTFLIILLTFLLSSLILQ